jgi:acetate kinase
MSPEAVTAKTRILVINCGSSSIKYALIAMGEECRVAGGFLERIGESGSLLHYRRTDPDGRLIEMEGEVTARNQGEAFHHIFEAMRSTGNLLEDPPITAIGHRVVHGGEAFTSPTLINSDVIQGLHSIGDLAPLHNPANIAGIEICTEIFPDLPNVAVFDTAFHQTMPPRAFRYAIPEEWYRDHGVRRFGFHGTSHRYVASRAAKFLDRPLDTLHLITLHLGNGASASAIQRGRCIDTSMGFTPAEGLIMGTRCGDLDPTVPLYMQKRSGATIDRLNHALNYESGLKGLCGTNDMREILLRADALDEHATLAVELYCYRIKKYIGSYSAALGRVDALIFTGGVGENSERVRRKSCEGLERFGIAIDQEANDNAGGEVTEIGQEGSPVRILVIRTDEELQIAIETLTVIRAGK